MGDLIAFLTRMLDRDEEIMRGAAKGWPPSLDGLSEAHAAHIDRYNPAATFSDLDAKRRTLVRCQEALLAASPILVHFARQTLEEMALAYFMEPGWQKDWRIGPKLREEVADDEQCGYIRTTWDGPYRMSDRCTAQPGHADGHGPWQMIE